MRTPYPNELRITNRETYSNELMHYGILGMKWGVRRYQNPDGTLTPAGRKRYGYGDVTNNEKFKKDEAKGRVNSRNYQRSEAVMKERAAIAYGGYNPKEIGISSIPETKSRGRTDTNRGFGDREDAAKKAMDIMKRSAVTGEYSDYLENKWDEANNTDRFPVDFLEAIQNSKILYDGDKQAMLIEYAYYLADPWGYLHERKLEEV